MSSGWWPGSVRIAIGAGLAVNVNNNGQAAEILLEDWPAEPGPRHLRAREAILRSVDNPEDPAAAKAAMLAFRDAAEEAHILRPGRPRPTPPPGSKPPRWRRRER